MQVKMFYRTQREVGIIINQIVDAYWDEEICEKGLINQITRLYTNNKDRIYKGNEFTTVLKQQCGKRRLEVVERIINMQQTKQSIHK
ncbi:TIGR04540 family protein [Alkalibacillus haloalkaliphilus]|uniref:TIGR04540 family protein n=1 Tax=Alkalibacillus haloalkaliphilus TaxID=94136 RepID=UPI0029360255|nr:TIGR04540 family protein [Alkalibacillus haloalkaliphilus]MDV2581662.1 TIGR04540 family protein [Alkalibacillus haloalkaliphilus]